MKNILIAFTTIAGLATASPAENIEARANPSCIAIADAWCCSSSVNLNIFFIRGVGSGCEQAGGTASSPTCPHPSKSKYLCCSSGHQITVCFSGFMSTLKGEGTNTK